ncbi:MAG: hypothetical protein DRH93_04420 [Deltaproteobacteria bacterium]|nr:MAG: hypothetical protein DRH93_04420 [Deltaproteobacteria bacterium]
MTNLPIFKRLFSVCVILVLLLSVAGPVLGDLPPEEEGICVQVRIRINQKMTLTRSAFRATLEINNAPEGVVLENLEVTLNIFNIEQEDSNNLFAITPPEVTGTSGVDGTGTIEPGTSASALWTIIPTRDAAPIVPTRYWIGGTLSYQEGDNQINIPLFPAHIWVKPDPLLVLHYFLVRDVFSDDPRTLDTIEPTEPFPLGLLMVNQGRGTAHKVQITSSQPEIIENEKGLLIDFTIIGTQVNTDQISPSLTVDLGDIEPGQTALAQWLMTCSLQGTFIEYTASFEHVDDFGDPRLSLIDSVDIHELNHVVRVDIPIDDYKPDFLANDVEDDDFLPDTLYKSDGSIEAVNVGQNPQVSGNVTSEVREVILTAEVVSGWTYIRTNDPGLEQFRLARVIRSDGREIWINDNAWTTHRTYWYLGEPAPFREHLVHIFDKDSTGIYTLIYEGGDQDGDGILDNEDNCMNVPNPIQENTDKANEGISGYPAGDDQGDACDPDDDNDGLSDVQEAGFGTNPKDPDSDNDDLTDGIEVQVTCCTSPNDPDTDNDQLKDGIEDSNHNGQVDTGETDPCNNDTDTDGMPDGFETQNNLDPLVNDALDDLDGDGFCNLREYMGETNPDSAEDRPVWTIVYVDDGNISGIEDGSMDHPFETIEKAMAFAGPHDRVYVFAGYYKENLVVTKPVDLQGEEYIFPVIDGSLDASPVLHYVNITSGSITGFQIRNGTGPNILCEQSGLLIRGNIISDASNGPGVMVDSTSSVTLFNNIIYNNASDGIRSQGTYTKVINNTITSNYGDGIDVTDSQAVVIQNNIATQNDGFGILCSSSPVPDVMFNNAYGNTIGSYSPDFGTGTGNLQADPFFTDAVNFDYHLTANSVCIDAGTSSGAPELDFEGHCRYDQPDVSNSGSGSYEFFDIGAFEFSRPVADLDGDGDVDGDDQAMFASYFGLTDCSGCEADLDGDGDVDGSDLTLFVADQDRFHCPAEACVGNLDWDLDVDGLDLSIFTSDFNRTDCDQGTPCEGDIDKDNDVDWFDFSDFIFDFGRTDCPVCPR